VAPITCRDIGSPSGTRFRMASMSVGFGRSENVVTLETHEKPRKTDACERGLGEKQGYIYIYI